MKFDYDAKRLEVMSQTAQAFYEVLGAQRRVELNEELARLAQELVPAIQERVKSGRASTIEESRNNVAVASARYAAFAPHVSCIRGYQRDSVERQFSFKTRSVLAVKGGPRGRSTASAVS